MAANEYRIEMTLDEIVANLKKEHPELPEYFWERLKVNIRKAQDQIIHERIHGTSTIKPKGILNA